MAKTRTSYKLKTLEAVKPIILNMALKFKRNFPRMEIEDLKQEAMLRTLVCIQKYGPAGDNFSFFSYLKRSLFLSLRRYVHKNMFSISIPERYYLEYAGAKEGLSAFNPSFLAKGSAKDWQKLAETRRWEEGKRLSGRRPRE